MLVGIVTLSANVMITAGSQNMLVSFVAVGANVMIPTGSQNMPVSLVALRADVMIAARGKRMVFNIGIARIVTAVHKDVVFIQRVALVMLSAVGKRMLLRLVAGVTDVVIPAGS